MIVVPSRDSVEKYKSLKEAVDLLVGRINGRYGTMNWTPIHYFYRGFSLAELSASLSPSMMDLMVPLTMTAS